MSILTPHLADHHGPLHPTTYPTITTLDDLAPHVAHNRGIRTFRNGPITIVRYLINDPSVFQTAWDLECRGLIFDSNTGLLLSRPFHKFFNISDKTSASTLCGQGNVRLVDKLDGSMIGGFVLDGTVRLHTKGGFSEQALAAESRMPDGVRALVAEAFADGYTPIFEWIGPENRIVIAYEREAFVLLALRHRTTGAYDEERADALAQRHNVRRPEIIATVDTADALWDQINRVAAMTGIEGVIAMAPNGWRMKGKTRSYLSVHKAMSMLGTNRHAFRAVVEEIDDDLVPLLPPNQAAFFEAYATALRQRVLDIGQEIEREAQQFAGLSGGALAKAIQQSVHPDRKPLMFVATKGGSASEALMTLFKRRTGSQTAVDETNAAYGLPAWNPPAGLFLQD